jgi:hypothetical protein
MDRYAPFVRLTCHLKDLLSPRCVLSPWYCSGHHHLTSVIGLLRVPPNFGEVTNGCVVTSSCSSTRSRLLPQTQSSGFPLFSIFVVQRCREKIHQIHEALGWLSLGSAQGDGAGVG